MLYLTSDSIKSDYIQNIDAITPELVNSIVLMHNTVHKDFNKAQSLDHLLKKSLFKKTEYQELIFNTIASDLDEYDYPWIDLSYEKYKFLKQEYKSLPFFNVLSNLRECTDCSLSRINNPSIRNWIEDHICNTIQNTHPNKTTTLVITDIATGNLFQLFIIIIKLINKGYYNFLLNIIDLSYIPLYKNYSKKSNLPYTILNYDNYKLLPKDAHYINNELYKAYNHTPHKPYYLTERFTTLANYSNLNNTLYQFTHWLKNIQNTTIDIILHPNINSYHQATLLNQVPSNSILLAVDYLIDIYPDLYIGWNKLSESTLNSRGTAYSVTKKADYDKESVYLSIKSKNENSHRIWNDTLKTFIAETR